MNLPFLSCIGFRFVWYFVEEDYVEDWGGRREGDGDESFEFSFEVEAVLS